MTDEDWARLKPIAQRAAFYGSRCAPHLREDAESIAFQSLLRVDPAADDELIAKTLKRDVIDWVREEIHSRHHKAPRFCSLHESYRVTLLDATTTIDVERIMQRAQLTPRQREVIVRAFWLGETGIEIARDFVHANESRVSQIKARAIHKMRAVA